MAEMLPQQRHRHILDELNKYGQVRVTALSHELGISEMTVRRDLNALATAGDLVKVHGGATRGPSATSSEPGFARKLGLAAPEKEALAHRAAGLIEAGMSVALNSGTTTYALAGQCTDIPDLTVITNSPRIAEVFYSADNASQTVILTGGIRTPSDALVGPLALAALAQLHVDICFMGVHGMTAEDGFTTPNMLEAQANRAFMASAAQHVVVADHSKWGITGLCQIAPLDAADVLVTGSALAPGAVEILEQSIDTVLLTPAP
ncbi:DeoR/GlpR family DNA-binding transcription regulator [Arthrobacter sp. JSM 101049]|uniref:DeoR/GlpR family DNA-binding transcription regulator n=1 Tax=Arthrobacter sp. JSM 101049 TaxID=929097 RepID=UPI003564E14F